MPSEHDLTGLLEKWSEDDPAARDRLTALVVDELRAVAKRHFARESPNHTLQPTALVGELYVRLLGRRTVRWQNRAQFFKAASDLMRCILVDHARRRRAEKRGGDVPAVSLEDVLTPAILPDVDHEALVDALDALEREAPHLREIVELKYFFGATHREIGEHLGVSPDTVKLRWKAAKARLYRELETT